MNQDQSIVNPDTQQKLNDLLVWMADSVRSGGSFLSEQAPLIAKEIVAWKMAAAYTWLVVLLVMFTASLVPLLLSRRRPWQTKDVETKVVDTTRNGAVGTLSLIALGFTFFVFLCVGGTSIRDIVKCHTAPRLVVLEEVTEMVRRAGR